MKNFLESTILLLKIYKNYFNKKYFVDIVVSVGTPKYGSSAYLNNDPIILRMISENFYKFFNKIFNLVQ
uniref:Uncharacterized protein n=1 Tax=Onchocerca volvulus TaxID=6282 RepID=A0A8R1TY04_ONCVO